MAEVLDRGNFMIVGILILPFVIVIVAEFVRFLYKSVRNILDNRNSLTKGKK